MIGIFDSGVGGICAYRQVRELIPREDIVYLADRRNAPYGTKTKDEILSFTKKNIKILRNMGARAVLIACCSASSIYHLLDPSEREISTPIITPAAALAAKGGRRIAVIATRHTVREGAFGREIGGFSDAWVIEMAEQELVSLVERGNRDGRVDPECRDCLSGIARRVREADADTLILGCTHFSHLEGEIGRLLPEVNIISPARVGAIEMVRKITPCRYECGKATYM